MASPEPAPHSASGVPHHGRDIDLEIEYFVDSIDDLTRNALNDSILQAAHWVFKKYQLQRLSISVSVVDDSTIQTLNNKHLHHDWPTDVISFCFDSGEQTCGEIIASWDTARRLCRAAGWSPQEELLLYVLHGLLHLVGLDDQDQEQRAIMRLTEQEYLQFAGFPGAVDYLARFDDVSY